MSARSQESGVNFGFGSSDFDLSVTFCLHLFVS